LNSVVSPTVRLTDAQQGDLNVPLDGKAINVIRSFPGRGAVVWGARTLDGNSGDWRYIPVRRTAIYVEQSIGAALRGFVFAPNDAQTWTAATAMVENFLYGMWKEGGLLGSTPKDAFAVRCGLGSTMTAQDVVEGNLIVHVLLAMTRPAEFVQLVFRQKVATAE
jgi:phage tail sheath protein FI